MFLNRIVEKTQADLVQRKLDLPLENLKKLAVEQPRPRDMVEALSADNRVHMIAEVKKASPSKGLLAPNLDPVQIAQIYEANGAAAISVLTEPHFFLGAPEYLTAIKQAVHVPVLRKDFIVDEYQVFEARAWGADAILLICAILDDAQLRHLLAVANGLRMRALVEVHTKEEAERAVEAGAVIIGVNSRDLITFKMNPYLIRDIRGIIPADRVVVAESGIHNAADARRLSRYDVNAMLVGESLVISPDVPTHMRLLLDGANKGTQIKICGLKTAEHIDAAIEAGADLLGFIFHEPSHRYIEPAKLRDVLQASKYADHSDPTKARPDLVGVFVNKEADYINEVAEQVGLHYVQLHGNETPEFCQRIKRPVIKAFALKEHEDLQRINEYRNVTWRVLLDTPTSEWGGTGQTSDWALAALAAKEQKIILAGGLNPENVEKAIQQVRPWGIDVSSGVESNKQKDSSKIQAFVQHVREAKELIK